MTCDFKHCGILTSVDSDEPRQPPFKLRNSKWRVISSFTLLEYASDSQNLWPDCAYAQAGLRLWWSLIPHCWKSHVAALQTQIWCKLTVNVLTSWRLKYTCAFILLRLDIHNSSRACNLLLKSKDYLSNHVLLFTAVAPSLRISCKHFPFHMTSEKSCPMQKFTGAA